MNKKVHIIPHVHWDREWYFTAEESKILLVNDMVEILEMLEKNDNYPYFILDGQTSILEDYLSVKPEDFNRIKNLVQDGKLLIGPWYTQTDEMVVGGESIVRNLLYGLKDCKKFGEPMKIGYLPDSFGQSSQMPQILNGFGIYYSIFWRGVSERHGTNKTEFYWESDNGSKVLVQILPLGYAIGKYLPKNKEELKKRIDKYLPVLEKGATTNNLIIPNGHDQMPIQKNIFEVMDVLKTIYPNYEFEINKYENIFTEIEKEAKVDTLKGEFIDGKYMRVHRSIFSTRMDIKSYNTRVENKITNILEPLATIAHSLGFEYYHGLIELIWKEILKSHAHDSIGCCCSDEVHADVLRRFVLADDKTNKLIEFYKRKIVDSMPNDIALDKLVLFNTLSYSRDEIVESEIVTKYKGFKLFDENGNEILFDLIKKEIVDAGIIDRQIVHYGNYDPFIKYTLSLKTTLPAMGYKTIFIKESENQNSLESKIESQIETEYYNISVNKNGSLKVFSKKLSKFFDNVLILEDGADDGDEYDYSPLKDDFIITSEDVLAKTEITNYNLFSEIKTEYTLKIPKDIESRKKKISDSDLKISVKLKIKNNSPIIETKIDILNDSKDHRLRAYIPTDIISEFSISDNQFGSIKRPFIDSAMEYWEKENWDERPDSIYPMLSYVMLCDENSSSGILTNSSREFEIIGDDLSIIALTLFRSVGFLGKEDMLRRPGRPSGIKLETKDSQMKGLISLDFAFYFDIFDKDKNNGAKYAKEYLTPIVAYNKMPFNAMKLNDVDFSCNYNYSLIESKNNFTILSVLKKSEENNSLVLRIYNPNSFEVNEEFKTTYYDKFYYSNLNEEEISKIDEANNCFCLSLKPNEVKTILLKK